MEKLLVCIASYNISQRMEYVRKLIEEFRTYPLDVHIIIDSNESCDECLGQKDIELYMHTFMEHPYHLTWMHRKHFVRELENYDWFMYVEDDILVSFDAFQAYMNNFFSLWPDYIPSFVRIEEKNGILYNTDNTSSQSLSCFYIEGKSFVNLGNPYHACWILPKAALKDTMTPNFNRLESWRELAASYPMWELKKIGLVALGEDGQVDPLCYTYHLPNNYALDPQTPFGKIEINKLLI